MSSWTLRFNSNRSYNVLFKQRCGDEAQAQIEAVDDTLVWSREAEQQYRELVSGGALQTTGTAITKVLPPASRFSKDGGHGEKKHRVIEKLGIYFERFFGLSVSGGQ